MPLLNGKVPWTSPPPRQTLLRFLFSHGVVAVPYRCRRMSGLGALDDLPVDLQRLVVGEVGIFHFLAFACCAKRSSEQILETLKPAFSLSVVSPSSLLLLTFLQGSRGFNPYRA